MRDEGCAVWIPIIISITSAGLAAISAVISLHNASSEKLRN